LNLACVQADGVVFAKVAALTRSALVDLCPQPTSPRGSSSSNGADGGVDSGSTALRPEVNPSRRREQLVRLMEAFRAAGVCPPSCLKPSEVLRSSGFFYIYILWHAAHCTSIVCIYLLFLFTPCSYDRGCATFTCIGYAPFRQAGQSGREPLSVGARTNGRGLLFR